MSSHLVVVGTRCGMPAGMSRIGRPHKRSMVSSVGVLYFRIKFPLTDYLFIVPG